MHEIKPFVRHQVKFNFSLRFVSTWCTARLPNLCLLFHPSFSKANTVEGFIRLKLNNWVSSVSIWYESIIMQHVEGAKLKASLRNQWFLEHCVQEDVIWPPGISVSRSSENFFVMSSIICKWLSGSVLSFLKSIGLYLGTVYSGKYYMLHNLYLLNVPGPFLFSS